MLAILELEKDEAEASAQLRQRGVSSAGAAGGVLAAGLALVPALALAPALALGIAALSLLGWTKKVS